MCASFLSSLRANRSYASFQIHEENFCFIFFYPTQGTRNFFPGNKAILASWNEICIFIYQLLFFSAHIFNRKIIYISVFLAFSASNLYAAFSPFAFRSFPILSLRRTPEKKSAPTLSPMFRILLLMLFIDNHSFTYHENWGWKSFCFMGTAIQATAAGMYR